MAQLALSIERFPIAGTFTIARGSKTEAVVVEARLTHNGATGRGECVPYARYGETVEGVAAAIAALGPDIATGLDREALQYRLPPGAARNALDCAFWDLEAKLSGMRVEERAGLAALHPLTTAFTLSLDTPEAMAQAAAAATAAGRPLLKLKLGAPGDRARLRAIRAAAPEARLIVDANEGWSPADLPVLLDTCAAVGVELVEQPLPAADDRMLARIERAVPVCADESVHDRAGLATLRERYDAVNIKLDKAGGFTEALALAEAAEGLGFGVMVGCMLASSLAMAPALLVAQRAQVVDLDGPLLLARDRTPGLRYEGAVVYPPEPELWG
ncbi:Mandelate racemase/muconate lactonizing protein [Xanthobacter versatilis]|uniref:Dipeptide epimerase n=1 Tax=Xanthobacter autotrophicus (strain ATCC BAA-1158 / Py2) TaxID=78245 RepID=A7IMU1_XANP2|nr:Mandelate racemase/muconate lactonizing protein [Xanthobacter autotrophicus Py2]